MKKLFLMSLMIVALVCVFAISVFAEDIIVSETDGGEYGKVIQLNADPGLDNAAQYVSTLSKIEDAGTDKDAFCIVTDGTYFYVFPSSYVIDERADGIFNLIATPLATAMAEFNAATKTDYFADYSISGTDASKRLNAIVRFEFTKDVAKLSDTVCCFRSYSYLEEIRFKYQINLNTGDIFKSSSKLKTVVGFEKADPTLGNSMFNGCSSLETITLPTAITKIPKAMFWGCKKITITNLAECTQLTTIGESAFQDTKQLNFVLPDWVTTIEKSAFQSAFKEGNGGSFVINKTSQLTTIGASAFEDCRKIPATVYIPSTVTSIGKNAFTKCTTLQTLENFENCQITTLEDGTFVSASTLKTLKLPKTLKTIGAAFSGNNNLTLVYIPESVTSVADTFTGDLPANAVYVYTGSNASVFANCTKLASANKIEGKDYDPEGTYSGINLVIGYSNCIAYNNGVHPNSEITTIFTSYLDEIGIYTKCTDCYVNKITGTIPALFTCSGFSSSEFGNDSVAIGFSSNDAAIEEYEKVSGKALSFGVFAVSESKLDGKEIFDENGNVATGVVKVEITNYEFALFELKIVGFTAAQKGIKFAMGAYVIATDKDGKAEYSYIQDQAPAEGANYYFASYSEIMNSLK